jgi:DNA polymerase IV
MKRVILHLDGDAFFASCEQAVNPALRGKPIATGSERSIATAYSYEAKALGVSRGMPIYLIKKHFPQVIIVPSQYHLYALMSRRMFSIVRRFARTVEEYSIDECFADLSSVELPPGETHESIARRIQQTIARELGLTVSVGLAYTKVLAKVASKMKKPAGFTSLLGIPLDELYRTTSIGKVWGIGRKASEAMAERGIGTVQDFISKDPEYIRQAFSAPLLTTWYELRGVSMVSVESHADMQQSVSKTRTFFPCSGRFERVASEFSKNVEAATKSLRELSCGARHAHIFIKTKDFRTLSAECDFAAPVATPSEALAAFRPLLARIFVSGVLYRSTGVTFSGLTPLGLSQDLFGESKKGEDRLCFYQSVDALQHKFGMDSLFLVSSLLGKPTRKRRFLAIPSMGEVS